MNLLLKKTLDIINVNGRHHQKPYNKILMRTIGYIDHRSHKITVLEHNNKITLQIESGLLSQSYTFRDGSPISNLSDVQNFCTPEFIAKIDQRFQDMNKDYFDQISEGIEEKFPVII